MKGKYLKQEEKNKKSFPWQIIVIIIAVVIMIGLLWKSSEQTPAGAVTPTVGVPQASGATVPEMEPINLGYGLSLEYVDNYTGAYIEDGSNEVISGVMMALVTNTSTEDLQYAKIVVAYADASFDFEVSDLPAGASAVLLEQNRQAKPEGNPISATSELVAFFSEDMSLHEDIFEISGMEGALNIRNISDSDITGKIYVHYKYNVQGIYYGGIAFRVQIEDGLKADELRQITVGHYNPDDCVIVAVEYTP